MEELLGLPTPSRTFVTVFIFVYFYIYEYVVVGKFGSHIPLNVVNYGRRLRLELGF